MTPVISVSNLKKYYQVFDKEPGLWGSIKSLWLRRYRDVRAIQDISFSIKEGELVGFIGPNGAGKTTTLKVLSGLLFPTSGNVQVSGFIPWERRDEFLKKITLVMGQKNQLWWELPAIDTFLVNRAVYEIPKSEFETTVSELAKLLDVKNLLLTPVRKLSLGQRMKMELIAALVHKPKVLFLDEPTIGLDVVMQQTLRDFVKEYNRQYHATIILTSHNMGDVKELAERVIIIHGGSIIFDGKLDQIVHRFAKHKEIRVIFSEDVDQEELSNLLQEIPAVGNVLDFNFPKAIISVKREAAPIAASQILQGFPVADLTIEEESIEDIIREVFRGKKVK
ncbi:MAG: ATP-binding cassette domain-containing protein [Candidatus Blackburnbacteria bacterium]|nr:ATP-binding cassette domain-containing protein [Candidatus Blackburnbacteria bacterium]